MFMYMRRLVIVTTFCTHILGKSGIIVIFLHEVRALLGRSKKLCVCVCICFDIGFKLLKKKIQRPEYLLYSGSQDHLSLLIGCLWGHWHIIFVHNIYGQRLHISTICIYHWLNSSLNPAVTVVDLPFVNNDHSWVNASWNTCDVKAFLSRVRLRCSLTCTRAKQSK